MNEDVREGVRERGIKGKSYNGRREGGEGDRGMEGERKDWKERGKEGRYICMCM